VCRRGQYVTQDFPRPLGGPNPHQATESGASRSAGGSTSRESGIWEQFKGPSRCQRVSVGHSLRDEMVEARHVVERRIARHVSKEWTQTPALFAFRRLAATRRTSRFDEIRDGKRGSHTVRMSRSTRSKGDRSDCSSPVTILERRSGCGESKLSRGPPGFWEGYGTTTTGTRGKNSGTRATDRGSSHVWRGCHGVHMHEEHRALVKLRAERIRRAVDRGARRVGPGAQSASEQRDSEGHAHRYAPKRPDGWADSCRSRLERKSAYSGAHLEPERVVNSGRRVEELNRQVSAGDPGPATILAWAR